MEALKQAMADAYKKLKDSQQDLPADLAKVLNDNLDTLMDDASMVGNEDKNGKSKDG